jgi:hypothetical protein
MIDGLDLSAAQLHNTHDVRAWPATAALTRFEFRPTGVHVEHTKRNGADCWPNFRPAGWDGDLQYTLWIFLQIAGAWHGSGCIQFWQACDENGGPPEEFAKNWYYAADRWAPMTGHQPTPGEQVGFMVSAGDARNAGAQTVQERSAIVVMPFPVSGAIWVTPAQPPAPPATDPATPPAADPASPVLVGVLGQMVAAFQAQEKALAELQANQAAALADLHATMATKQDLIDLRRDIVNQAAIIAGALRGVLAPPKK